MLQKKPTPFGAWEPDAISIRPGAAEVIENVRPTKDGYAPLEAPVRHGVGVPDQPYTADQFLVEGTPTLFSGSADSVYRIRGESRERIGTGYTAGEEFGWGMDLFDNIIVVCNENDGILSGNAANGTLTPLAGSPPKARIVKEFEGFLMACQVSGYTSRVQWSGYRNIETWVPDSATQSDVNDLPSKFGDIRGMSSSPYGTIYQRRGITRVTFIGGLAVFRFDTLVEDKGLKAKQSLVSTEKRDYFLSDDGFNMWDGRTAVNIDEDRIKTWFEANCTESNRYFVKGAVDYRRKMIFWTWPDSTYFLAYSYLHNRWVRGKNAAGFDETNMFPISAPRAGIDLDTDAPGEAVDLDAADALPDSYDHPYWRQGGYSVGFLHNGDMSLFTGSPMEATLETADMTPQLNRRSDVHEFWPQIDVGAGSGLAGSIGSKNQRVGDTVAYSTEEVIQASGFCPVRASGRFFRGRARIPAGETWTVATGALLSYEDAGDQ